MRPRDGDCGHGSRDCRSNGTEPSGAQMRGLMLRAAITRRKGRILAADSILKDIVTELSLVGGFT